MCVCVCARVRWCACASGVLDEFFTLGLIISTTTRAIAYRGGIELRNVTFAYPTRPEKLVCKDYSLRIEAGKTVALCGPSGEVCT